MFLARKRCLYIDPFWSCVLVLNSRRKIINGVIKCLVAFLLTTDFPSNDDGDDDNDFDK
jgi:hypothetical protein